MNTAQTLERIGQRLLEISELSLSRGRVTYSADCLALASAVRTLQRSAVRGDTVDSEDLAALSRRLDALTYGAPADSEEQRLADAASLSASGLEELAEEEGL